MDNCHLDFCESTEIVNQIHLWLSGQVKKLIILNSTIHLDSDFKCQELILQGTTIFGKIKNVPRITATNSDVNIENAEYVNLVNCSFDINKVKKVNIKIDKNYTCKCRNIQELNISGLVFHELKFTNIDTLNMTNLTIPDSGIIVHGRSNITTNKVFALFLDAPESDLHSTQTKFKNLIKVRNHTKLQPSQQIPQC